MKLSSERSGTRLNFLDLRCLQIEKERILIFNYISKAVICEAETADYKKSHISEIEFPITGYLFHSYLTSLTEAKNY